MEYLNIPFETKGVDEQGGRIEGYGSIFGIEDLQGDVVCRGAFAKTIKANPSGWPMLMGHQMSRPVGFWTNAREDSKGLFLEGEFTLDSADGASAAAICRHAHRLGQPFGLSIGYRIPPGGAKDDGHVRKLLAIELLEISLAAIPACPPARVVAVKADEGRDRAAIDRVIGEFLHEKLGYSYEQINRGLRLPTKQAQMLRDTLTSHGGFSNELIDSVLMPPTPGSEVEASAADIAKAFRDAQFRVARRREYLAELLDSPRPPRSKWMPPSTISDAIYDEHRDRRVKYVEDAIRQCKTADEVKAALYTMGFEDKHVNYMTKSGLCEP